MTSYAQEVDEKTAPFLLLKDDLPEYNLALQSDILMQVGEDIYKDVVNQIWHNDISTHEINISYAVFNNISQALFGMGYCSGTFVGRFFWGAFPSSICGDASWISNSPNSATKSLLYIRGNIGIHVRTSKDFPLIDSVANKILEKIERNLSPDIRAAENRAKMKQITTEKYRLMMDTIVSGDAMKNYTLLPQYDSKWVVDDSTIVMGRRTEWKNESGTTIGVDVCEFETAEMASQAANIMVKETYGYIFEMTDSAAVDSLILMKKENGISHKVLPLVSSNNKYAVLFYMIDPVELDTSLYSSVVKSVVEKISF
jgi:hypothetical protein